MQATPTVTAPSRFGRNLSYFLLAPLTAFVLITLALAVTIAGYESRHNGRIYTGVSVWGVDLGGLTPDEAAAALRAAFPYPQEAAITFTDPVTGDQWQQTPADFGLSFDVDATIAAAYAVGREGGVGARLRTLFDAWYAGQAVAPVVIFDEGQLDAGLAALAGTVNQAPVNAQVDLQGTQTTYAPGRFGRQLADSLYRGLHFLVGIQYRPEHLVFTELLRL